MSYPKIGIRPIIDGRWGGVRESLEDATMAMAKAAKGVYRSNVYYSDGTRSVRYFPHTGGGAEAAKCAEYFATRMLLRLCPLPAAGATAAKPWTLT